MAQNFHLHSHHTGHIQSYISDIQALSEEQKRQEEADLLQKRSDFKKSLESVLHESKGKGDHHAGLGTIETSYYIQEDGNLTDAFKQELQQMKEEEIKLFEQNLSASRPPNADIFGIKRSYCEVCRENCIGYEPCNNIISSHKQDMEFPTFCSNCSCPAYFHKVALESRKFPDELANMFVSHNICSQDLNFNSVLAVFLINDKQKGIENISEIVQLLTHTGIEIVSLQKRFIGPEEGFYLRNRIIGSTQKLLGAFYDDGYIAQRKETEIKRQSGNNQMAINRIGDTNPFLIEQYSKQQEQDVIRLKNRYSKHEPSNTSFSKSQKQKMNNSLSDLKSPKNQSNPQSSPQKLTNQNQLSSRQGVDLETIKEINESVVSDNDLERDDDQLIVGVGLQKEDLSHHCQEKARNILMPRKRVTFQFGKKMRCRDSHCQHKIVDTNIKHHQIDYLDKEIEQNPLMQDLCNNELVLVVLNSTRFQNLLEIILKTLKSSLIPPEEVPLIYISPNKVQGLEDCIHFCPNLFNLKKSIVISEPLLNFKQFLDQRLGLRQKDMQKPLPEKEQGFWLQKKVMEIKLKIAREFQPQRNQKQVNDLINSQQAIQRRQTIEAKSPLRKINTIGGLNRDKQLQRSLTNIPKNYSASSQFHRCKTTQISEKDETKDCVQNDPVWLQSIKEKEIKKQLFEANNKTVTQTKKSDALLYNFGVMQDFFNYSGMSIQDYIKTADLTKPLIPSGIRGGATPLTNFGTMQSQPCNIFQISKIGLPNIIFPNSLDIKFSNFENQDSVLQIQDMFFPEQSKVQQSVIVFRPMIVKNNLNETFIQILRSNNFLILKRKIRILTKSEIWHLFKEEQINEDNSAFYFEIMNSGPAEIVIVSKIGAICDAKTLFNGAAPYGRRRINQLNESQSLRLNLSYVDSMFEIAPFSSFCELFDIEDFLIRNSNIKKYKNLADFNKSAQQLIKSTHEKEKLAKSAKTAETLYYTKIEEIRSEIDSLGRHFNFAGYTSNSITSAEQEICIFAPKLGQLEEVVFVLNPIYNLIVDDVFELLLRSNFTILAHSYVVLSQDNVDNLFAKKYEDDSQESQIFLHSLVDCQAHVFHLLKVAADKECRERWYQSSIMFEDLITPQNWQLPLLPEQIPFLFLFLDFEDTFEEGLKLLYDPKCLSFTGNDFNGKLEKPDILRIIQTCLLTTVGDKIKTLIIDNKGGQVRSLMLTEQEKAIKDQFLPVNTIEHCYHDIGLVDLHEHQVFLQPFSQLDSSQAVQFTVEAEKHGLFEIKLHRLAHRGDTNKFEALSQEERITAKQEAKQFFQQFASLSFYYNEVNKISQNICPSFYKFKIQPFDDVLEIPLAQESFSDSMLSERLEQRNIEKNQLNRVFQVEEFMGNDFIEDLAQMHFDHLKIIEHAMFAFSGLKSGSEQKSLPAYVFGGRLAQMCERLEKIKCHSGETKLKGAGKIIFDESISNLRGELPKITESSYLKFDRERYLRCLDNFRQGWEYYLSILEIEIIEVKLMTILDSLTFKYARQPQFLRVYPDRLTTQNLRISKRFKVLSEQDPKEVSDPDTGCSLTANRMNDQKIMFKQLSDVQTNPDRELELNLHVESHMKILLNKSIKKRVQKELNLAGTTLEMEKVVKKREEAQEEQNKFSISKHCSLTGFEAISRRPKYHLFANILWLIDFNWRKLDRRPECFLGERAASKNTMQKVEKEYDEILDILKISLCKNFGEEEINMGLDIFLLKQGSYETEFEKHLRMKTEQQEKRLKAAQQVVEEERRKRRNDVRIDISDLIKTEVWDPIDEGNKRQREEIKNFLNSHAMQDVDGAKFMKYLEESKIKFGPYAMKVAEDYITKQKLQEQMKNIPGTNFGQEKISFIMMEYFLFGVIEADRIIGQLKTMELTINMLQDDLAIIEDKVKSSSEQLQKIRVDMQNKSDRYLEIEKRHLNRLSRMNDKIKEVQEYRYRISIKETELLLIFRELESCDFYVPDHLFEQFLKKSKENKKVEQYTVPLKTFWKPVHVDYNIDTDIKQEKYQKSINTMPKLTKENYGDFLAPKLRQSLLRTDIDKIEKLQKGERVPGLRNAQVTKFPENLVMDKFFSHAEMEQAKIISDQREIINRTLQRENEKLDIPFNF